MDKISSKIPFNIGVQYNYNYYGDIKNSFLKLSAGENFFYQIDDVKAFLTALKHKEIFQVCSSFSYMPERHGFRRGEVLLIKLIAASNEYGAEKYNGEKVYLTEDEVKRFFAIMKNRNFEAVIQNKIYSNIKINEYDMPLKFEIKREKEKVSLTQLNEIPMALTDCKDYFLFLNNIYKPSELQVYKYLPYYKDFMNNGKPYVEYFEEDTERLASLINFKLKNVSKEIKYIEPKCNNKIEAPLKINISVEMDNENIVLKNKFCYGDVEIDPFSDTKYRNAEKVSKRDVSAETQCVDIIKRLGFTPSKNGFIMENSDDIISFIKEGKKKLEDIGEVSYSEEFKNIKVYEDCDYSPKIYFHSEYLEFTLGLTTIRKINQPSSISDGNYLNLQTPVGVKPTSEVVNKSIEDDALNTITYGDIINIFEAFSYGEKYYRLRNGNYISLKNEELEKIIDIIGERPIRDNSAIDGYFTVQRVVSYFTGKERTSIRRKEQDVEKQRESEKLYLEKNHKLKEILGNMEKVNDDEFLVPPELFEIMRGYQKVGFKWFKTLASLKIGGILADEMGLGKTLQAIALILAYVEENEDNKRPAMVVAPTSLVYNWENEIQKFAPQLKTVVMHGTQSERRNILQELEKADVIITSYSLVAKDIEEYINMKFSYCFIDEAQQIKNPRTQSSKAVKRIDAEARFALTGTPIENSLSELWSIFDFIMPGYLLSNRIFKDHYETPIVQFKDSKALESLNNIIRPFILRRLKSEVMYELPPKIERRLVIDMTDEQKEAYEGCLNYVKNSLNDEFSVKGFNRSQIHIFAALMKLRQVCCDPSIVLPEFTGESAKMLVLDNIIEECAASGRRILLFSQFVSVLQKIEIRLKNNGVKYLYMDGSVKGSERLGLVNEFNDGDASIFLISLKTGGFGLNLTGADVVIHFDPWWNPAVEDQATDRAHRIGQTKTVDVIKIITKGTIEERILKLHERKKNLVKSVISNKDNENNFISKLSEIEMEELLK